jgi:hypothetical protein
MRSPCRLYIHLHLSVYVFPPILCYEAYEIAFLCVFPQFFSSFCGPCHIQEAYEITLLSEELHNSRGREAVKYSHESRGTRN